MYYDFACQKDLQHILFINYKPFGQQTIQYLLWDFGDGNTSTLQNPSHAIVMVYILV